MKKFKRILIVSKYSPPWMSVPLLKNITRHFKNDISSISKNNKISFPFWLFSLPLTLIKKSTRTNKVIIYNDLSLLLITFPFLKLISHFKKLDCYYIFESKWFSKYADYLGPLFSYTLNRKIYKKIFVFDDLLRRYLTSKGVNKEKIVEISTGVDTKIFRPASNEKEFEFKLVYVGSIYKIRKMEVLIEAVEMIKKEYPEIELKIIGDGPGLDDLKLLVGKRLLRSNVTFTGRLPQEKIVTHIQDSDICLAQYPPNTFNIQFPYKILEYFACKKPVITTETIATRKYLRNGVNCIFCQFKPEEIAKSIALLISNESLRIKVSMEGYNLSKQFKWEEVLNKMNGGLFS